MEKQELKINTLENMMEQNTKDHLDIKKDIEKISDKLDKSIDKSEENMNRMEKRFAPIWVKNVVVWIGGVVGAFLVVFALSQIFK